MERVHVKKTVQPLQILMVTQPQTLTTRIQVDASTHTLFTVSVTSLGVSGILVPL